MPLLRLSRPFLSLFFTIIEQFGNKFKGNFDIIVTKNSVGPRAAALPDHQSVSQSVSPMSQLSKISVSSSSSELLVGSS